MYLRKKDGDTELLLSNDRKNLDKIEYSHPENSHPGLVVLPKFELNRYPILKDTEKRTAPRIQFFRTYKIEKGGTHKWLPPSNEGRT